MSKKYCKICGNEMVLGHFGYYCSHTELHPESPCEAKCEKETITINKEDYEAMSERDETLIKKNIELQKQLEEKKKEIDKLKRIGEKGHLNDLLEDKRKENSIIIRGAEQLLQQLQSQPAEIVEKIKEWGQKHYNWVGDGTGYDGQDYNECIGFNMAIDQLNEVLDTILQEYQK